MLNWRYLVVVLCAFLLLANRLDAQDKGGENEPEQSDWLHYYEDVVGHNDVKSTATNKQNYVNPAASDANAK